VIVNLFKAGDTAARELQGITLVSICRKMFTNMLRKRMSPSAPARGSGGVQKQRSCTDNCVVLTRILQEAGKANKTVMRSFWTRSAYDTVWRMGYPLLEKGVDGNGGSCET
jgi:hypothetical protein